MYNTTSPVWEKSVSNQDITTGWCKQATVWWSYSSNTTVHGMLDSLLNVQHATHSSTPTIIFCQHNDRTLSKWWSSGHLTQKNTPSFGPWNSMFIKKRSPGRHHHRLYSPRWALASSLGYTTVNWKSLLCQFKFIHSTDTYILFSTIPKEILCIYPLWHKFKNSVTDEIRPRVPTDDHNAVDKFESVILFPKITSSIHATLTSMSEGLGQAMRSYSCTFTWPSSVSGIFCSVAPRVPLNMGLNSCPKTSIRKYRYSLRSNPEKHSAQKWGCLGGK